jgi:hypothetical protein
MGKKLEKRPGIGISSDLDSSEHVIKAISEAIQILGLIL